MNTAYISKDEVINAFGDFANKPNEELSGKSIKDVVLALPKAEVTKVRKGRWLKPTSPYAWYKCKCDQCGYEAQDSGWTYDPLNRKEYDDMIMQYLNFVTNHPFCTKCGAAMYAEN